MYAPSPSAALRRTCPSTCRRNSTSPPGLYCPVPLDKCSSCHLHSGTAAFRSERAASVREPWDLPFRAAREGRCSRPPACHRLPTRRPSDHPASASGRCGASKLPLLRLPGPGRHRCAQTLAALLEDATSCTEALTEFFYPAVPIHAISFETNGQRLPRRAYRLHDLLPASQTGHSPASLPLHLPVPKPLPRK